MQLQAQGLGHVYNNTKLKLAEVLEYAHCINVRGMRYLIYVMRYLISLLSQTCPNLNWAGVIICLNRCSTVCTNFVSILSLSLVCVASGLKI